MIIPILIAPFDPTPEPSDEPEIHNPSRSMKSKIDTRREELFGDGTVQLRWDSIFFLGFAAGAAVMVIAFILVSYFA